MYTANEAQDSGDDRARLYRKGCLAAALATGLMIAAFYLASVTI